MLIQLITSENDAGRMGARAGQGPEHLLAAGLGALLEEVGHRVEVVPVAPREAYPAEITSAFLTAAALAKQVRSAFRQRRFPLVLAGNCIASLGVAAGLKPGRRGIVWIDPHGDLERPETTRSGVLDRMALATILGEAWPELARTVPRFTPLGTAEVLLLGAQAMEPGERRWAADIGLALADHRKIRHEPPMVAAMVERLSGVVDRLHLHIDLRVLAAEPEDTGEALTADELLELVRQLRGTGKVASLTVASYDPSRDPVGYRRDAAIGAIRTVLEP